jgi:hypothetical protein
MAIMEISLEPWNGRVMKSYVSHIKPEKTLWDTSYKKEP